MKNDYVKPKYNTLEFTCCKCNKFCLHESISFEISTSTKVWSSHNHDLFDYQNKYIWENKDSIVVDGKKPLIKNTIQKTYDALYDQSISNLLVVTRICSKCGNRCYWEIITKYKSRTKEKDSRNLDDYETEEKIIYPNIPLIDIEPNEDLTNEQKQLFNEAKDIFDKSPKAAGALLRCVIERILRDKFQGKLGQSLLGKILNDEEVKKELGGELIEMCNACKLIGNDAAHSSLIIYEDESKQEVELLFELINAIAEKLLSKPRKRQEMLDKSKKINELKK